METEGRLEKLRQVARKRLGVHVMPIVKDRFKQNTQV